MDQLQLVQEIEKLENELVERKKLITELRKKLEGKPVENYRFKDPSNKEVTLLELFQDKDELILIHNMGKRCNYCTMWADGFNSIYHHIIQKAAFVLTSPDSPEVQGDIAAERSWVFPIVSAQEGTFIRDMGFQKDGYYYPGASVFTKDQEGNIYHHTKTPFGPGDDFCSVWSFFDLLPSGYEEYVPQDKINSKSPFQLTNNIAVQVRDYEKAIDFYQNTLGFTITQQSPNESRLSLNYLNLYVENSPDNNTFFELAVENMTSAKELLLKNGCKVTKEYNETSIMIQDPYGLRFHVFETNK